jgi:hypothetical protein
LACQKAKDLGYPHELWTTRLLARHAREHGPAEGHACLANLAQGTVCKILDQDAVKPAQSAILPETARSRLCGKDGRRHIRVASKQELKERIMAAMDFFNQQPVVHTWTYKLDKAT